MFGKRIDTAIIVLTICTILNAYVVTNANNDAKMNCGDLFSKGIFILVGRETKESQEDVYSKEYSYRSDISEDRGVWPSLKRANGYLVKAAANVKYKAVAAKSVSKRGECDDCSVENGKTRGSIVCDLTIRCDDLLRSRDRGLDLQSQRSLPDDGVILRLKDVPFCQGDTVFDILQRACDQNKVHMEFSTTRILKTCNIKAIEDVYEFDGGDLSKWTYSVNGKIPDFGSNKYKVEKGDKIEWVYICAAQ